MAILVLAVVGVGVVVKIGGPGSGESGRPVDAAEVVEDYLHAVADGKAREALDHLAKEPDNTTLLTDKMLKASNKMAPITDITVSKPETTDVDSVRVQYKIGSKSITGDYSVSRSDGDYVLNDGYAELKLHKKSTKLPLSINGETVKSHRAIVFPGTYRLDTTSPYMKLAHTWKLTVKMPVTWAPKMYPTPRLTERGQKLFRKKVIEDAKACVASRKLKPGCGLGLSTKGHLKEGTVSRKVNGSGWQKFKKLEAMTTDPSNPMLVTAKPVAVFVKTTVEGGGGSRIKLFGKPFPLPKMDLSKRHPEVVWG